MRFIQPYIQVVLIAVLSVLLNGCSDSNTNPTAIAQPQDLTTTTPAPKDAITVPTIKEQEAPKEESHLPHEVKVEELTATYTLDTTVHKLRVAQNVITFFISNPDYMELEAFRRKGFPMEFWGTSMCSFFALPMNELDSMKRIAARLGYKECGYRCESLTDKEWTHRILTNQLLVGFYPTTQLEHISATINSAKFYDVQFLNYANVYLLRVKDGSARNIVDTFNKLSKDKKIMRLEYNFGSCEELKPPLH